MKCIFADFLYLKTVRMALFYNLFIEQPSYR